MRITSLCLLLAACGSGGGFPDAGKKDAPGATGTFSVAWSVLDQNSVQIDCDRVAAQVMTVLTHNTAFEGGSTEPFGCSTLMGTSQGLVPGRYEMNFDLSGTFGQLARGAKQIGVIIEANANTELMPVTFQLDAIGGVALKLSSGKPGGNCGAANAGGAAIDAVSITLTHNSDGACEPITLSIAAGATQPGGTYTINCTTPVERPCIEADQEITASTVPSDSYTIRIRGKVSGKVCWANGDTIQVPPLNKILTRTLNLAQQTQTPGC
jgi:hypothetical protein